MEARAAPDADRLGGALGLAIITTIADSRVTHLAAAGVAQHAALAGGFDRGLIVAAAVAAVNLVVAVRSPRVRPTAEMVAAATAAA